MEWEMSNQLGRVGSGVVGKLPGSTVSNIEKPTDQGALVVDHTCFGAFAVDFMVLGSVDSRDPVNLGV